MGIFDVKTIVSKYEDQFKVKEMRNKHLFYDLYARTGDPEEVRSYVQELMQDMDWKTSVNELTEWNEPDTEGIYRGGKLKPIRTIVKSHKELVKGPMFPWLWKGFFVLGIIALIFYLYTIYDVAAGMKYNPSITIMAAAGFFFLAIIVYMIKERVHMAVWVKIAGVYDIASEEADVRIVIAADAEKADKVAFDKLESEMSELYNVLSRKYVKRKELATEIKSGIAKEIGTRKKEPAEEIIKGLSEVNSSLRNIDKQLAEGKITEATYKSAKESLQGQKTKLETLIDLLSM
jgi:hypothetical protein